jgi:hypothetical protein
MLATQRGGSRLCLPVACWPLGPRDISPPRLSASSLFLCRPRSNPNSRPRREPEGGRREEGGVEGERGGAGVRESRTSYVRHLRLLHTIALREPGRRALRPLCARANLATPCPMGAAVGQDVQRIWLDTRRRGPCESGPCSRICSMLSVRCSSSAGVVVACANPGNDAHIPWYIPRSTYLDVGMKHHVGDLTLPVMRCHVLAAHGLDSGYGILWEWESQCLDAVEARPTPWATRAALRLGPALSLGP